MTEEYTVHLKLTGDELTCQTFMSIVDMNLTNMQQAKGSPNISLDKLIVPPPSLSPLSIELEVLEKILRRMGDIDNTKIEFIMAEIYSSQGYPLKYIVCESCDNYYVNKFNDEVCDNCKPLNQS